MYLPFKIFGTNPFPYRVLLISVLAFNAILVCQLSYLITKQQVTSLVSGFLFILFPLTPELTYWITGLGIACSTALTLLAIIYFTLFIQRDRPKFLVISLLVFFTALFFYETAIVLTGYLLAILVFTNRLKYLKYLFFYFSLTVVYLLIRVLLMKNLGGYGGNVLSDISVYYILNYIKLLAKLLIYNPTKVAGIIVSASIFIILIGINLIKKRPISKEYYKTVAILIFGILIFLTPGALLGISFTLMETSRLLHLASPFLCILLVVLIKRSSLNFCYKGIIVSALAITFSLPIYKDAKSWRKSSDLTQQYIGLIKKKENLGKVYLLNVPLSINGAYVFRNGLVESLMINDVKVSYNRVVVLGIYFWETDETSMKVIKENGRYLLQTNAKNFVTQKLKVNMISKSKNQYDIQIPELLENDLILYYNLDKFVEIN